MNLTVQVHKDEDGYFWASVDEIPGCLTQGDTLEELEANLADAIEVSIVGLVDDYVESLKQRFEPEPGDEVWTMALTLKREKAASKTNERR